MSYLDVLILFILPLLAAALRWWLVDDASTPEATSRRAGSEALVALVVIANLWTTPWDNLMVVEHVWTYDPDVVLGHIWHIPLEEQLFFSLQTLLTGAFTLMLTRGELGNPARSDAGIRVFWLTILMVVIATATGVIAHRNAFYASTMLVWFGLPVAIQWFYGADIIWQHRRIALPAVLVPTVYLCALDRMAIGAGVWDINDATSIGFDPLGLPIEEIVFFTLTNVLVVQGVLLYIHVRQHGWRSTT
ncbi:MAG: lycopene cyclase domain-containing protein [Myxococcota bacterium]